MKTMTLTINNVTFNNVPVDMARGIEAMLNPYRAKAETPKAEPKKTTKAKAEPKATPKVKVYSVLKDGRTVSVGDNGFIPTKVFKGVTYSLKMAGAQYDPKTHNWTFATKKACGEWCKAQDARG